MKRKKLPRLFLIMMIAFAVTWVGYYAATGPADGANQRPSSGEMSDQTAIARVGELTIIATGSGQIIPAAETKLSFQESGVLVELLVKVGNEVKAGDILARLQTDKTPTQLVADIAGADLALIEAQQALDKLYETAEIEAAKALRAVEVAQQALEAVKDVDLEQALALQAIAEVKAAIEDAEMLVYILNSSPSQDAIYTAFASTLFKEKQFMETLDQIETTRFKIKSATNDIIRDRLEMQLLRLNVQVAEQQIVYENAVNKYNRLDDPTPAHEFAVAEAQLTTALAQLTDAQQKWEDIHDGPAPDEIALAEAGLAEAQAEWERLKDGPDPEEVSLVKAELATAQARLALVQQKQVVEVLVAPTEGTVLAINAVEGEYIHTGTILSLADLSQPVLEVYLDETDLDKVGRGHEVEIIFEALPDKTFTGQIEMIDPSLAEVSHVQAVRALVRLDTTSYAKPLRLPVGLNATVDVIAGRATNAVLIPVEALYELSPGEYAVYIPKNDSYVLKRVSVGLMNYTNAEILDGLAAGDIVATGNIPTGNEP